MAKDREKAQARLLYIELGKSQRDISDMLGVAEKTVSSWAIEGQWKAARTARMTSTETMMTNGKQAISNLSDIMLELQGQRAMYVAAGLKTEIAMCDASIMSIADAISKYSSSIVKFEKNNTVTLVSYLNVMDSIFKALREENPQLHDMTLDFQERHVQEMSKKLG